MTFAPMESTTLVTFLLQHPTARKVELLGSWDNFSEAYAMEQDCRRGRGTWSGCHTFRDIVCDGDEHGIHEKRTGGLMMGGTYWYFYRVDDDVEYYDPTQETTAACPLMPGQTLNVLDVPFDVERFGSHSRSASTISLIRAVKTRNPEDRYVNPQPKAASQLPQPVTSAQAATSARHILDASITNAERSRKRPWTTYVAGVNDRWPDQTEGFARRYIYTAPTGSIDVAAQNCAATFSLRSRGIEDVLTPDQGGRGRSRLLRSDSMRTRRSRSPDDCMKLRRQEIVIATEIPTGRDESTRSTEMVSAGQAPLFIKKQMLTSSNLLNRRVQETNTTASRMLDGFPVIPEQGAASNTEFALHHCGFSGSSSSRRSASTGRKREPSPLRYPLWRDEEARAIDDLAIPTCVPEVEVEDVFFSRKHADTFEGNLSNAVLAVQYHESSGAPGADDSPPMLLSPQRQFSGPAETVPTQFPYLVPEPLVFRNKTNETHQALRALDCQYANARHDSPWRSEFGIPLPDSPEPPQLADSEAASPTFSSIQGDMSDTCTSCHLSELQNWPLRSHHGFDAFDFQLGAGPNLNQNFEHLSIHTTETTSTTSTVMPYQLPTMDPFVDSKISLHQPQQREPTQMEQLLDEFEYLGAALS